MHLTIQVKQNVQINFKIEIMAQANEATNNSINKFLGDFSKIVLLQNKDNAIYSPYSIVSAMCLALAGAEGETLAQIRQTLGLNTTSEIAAAIDEITTQLKSIIDSKGDVLFINKNKAVFEQSIKIKDAYKDNLVKKFDSETETCDFAGNPKPQVEKINKWVAEVTRGMITDLLSEDAITRDTRAVILNALYFKGNWKIQFDKEKTELDKFYLQDGSTIDTDFMYDKMRCEYAKFPQLNCTAVKLVFKNSDWKLLFVLPNDVNGLPALVDQLFVSNGASDALSQVFGGRLYMRNVAHVWLPKFKVRKNISVKDTLKDMGMPRPFANHNEFKGITEDTNLYIDDVIHEAVFEIDEEGAEGAAATAFPLMRLSGSSKPPEIFEFKANHPFLFALLSSNNTCLFIGRIANPKQ